MSKITITKEYDSLDDGAQLQIDMSARSLYDALFEIKQYIRGEWKHGEYNEDTYNAIDKIYGVVCDECCSTGIDF